MSQIWVLCGLQFRTSPCTTLPKFSNLLQPICLSLPGSTTCSGSWALWQACPEPSEALSPRTHPLQSHIAQGRLHRRISRWLWIYLLKTHGHKFLKKLSMSPLWLTLSISIFIQEKWKHMVSKDWHTIVHSSFICNSLLIGNNPKSIKRWLSQRIVAYPFNGMPFSNRKNWTTGI
jgi:hypothetical protein